MTDPMDEAMEMAILQMDAAVLKLKLDNLLDLAKQVINQTPDEAVRRHRTNGYFLIMRHSLESMSDLMTHTAQCIRPPDNTDSRVI